MNTHMQTDVWIYHTVLVLISIMVASVFDKVAGHWVKLDI